MQKHIWLILTKGGSLRVAWVSAFILKGRSFLQVGPCSQKTSSSWRKLLQLRGLAAFIFEQGLTKFHTGSAWQTIRDKQPKVEWQRLVCFPSHITRNSIVSWMAILNRLPTSDRLQCWGFAVSNRICLLCVTMMWSQTDHLFFNCII